MSLPRQSIIKQHQIQLFWDIQENVECHITSRSLRITVVKFCMVFVQEHNIWSRIEQYKPVYVEPRTKSEFQVAMINFYDKIQDNTANGAVFAAVCRGKVQCTLVTTLGGSSLYNVKSRKGFLLYKCNIL